MPRKAPPLDPFTRDAEGNRIFAPGTVSKRKHAALTDRERELYRLSLLPHEEQQHARFRELQQESVKNLQRREAIKPAPPIVETEKPAEANLQQELARQALQRKDKLNKAAVRRNWEAENGVRTYFGMPRLTDPIHSISTLPIGIKTPILFLMSFKWVKVYADLWYYFLHEEPLQIPRKRVHDNNSAVAGIQPTQLFLEVPVPVLMVQPAKRRRIQTDDARAKAIARQAAKKASERKAMSISLPEVPAWVGELIEPEMEVCGNVLKIPLKL